MSAHSVPLSAGPCPFLNTRAGAAGGVFCFESLTPQDGRGIPRWVASPLLSDGTAEPCLKQVQASQSVSGEGEQGGSERDEKSNERKEREKWEG